ncbi:hypothetical protein E2C01_069481 [Portunus trituberculatus]|uniref:Uncharacterized protein n=1 Tax=Portunus trituberculatus TaxID=210409 RepID=A0A5B7HZG5_PORTR|nr:hypothetical protein [Portunus trituberculatus]
MMRWRLKAVVVDGAGSGSVWMATVHILELTVERRVFVLEWRVTYVTLEGSIDSLAVGGRRTVSSGRKVRQVWRGVHLPPAEGERDTNGRKSGRSFLESDCPAKPLYGGRMVLIHPKSTLTEADPP